MNSAVSKDYSNLTGAQPAKTATRRAKILLRRA